MDFSNYVEKKLRNSGFHKTLMANNQNAIKRLRLEVDFGEHDHTTTVLFSSCKTPLDYAKAYLHKLCKEGLCKDAFGFETKEFFTQFYFDFINEENFRKKSRPRQIEFASNIPDHQLNENLISVLLVRGLWQPHQIPDSFNKEKIFLLTIEKSPDFIKKICESSSLTSSMVLMAVSKDPDLLRHIPEKFKTKEVCMSAFNKSPNCFFSIPKRFVTKEMSEISVKYNSSSIECVPERFIDKDMALSAVARNACCLRYLPKQLLDQDFYTNALRLNEDVYRFMTTDMKEAMGSIGDLIDLTNGKIIHHLRYSEITEDVCIKCLDKNFLLIKEIPDHLFTDKVAQHAIGIRGEAVLFLPSHLLTPAIIEKATESFPYALLQLLGKNKAAVTPELVMTAVRKDYKVMATLPKEMVTAEVLIEAIRQNGALLSFVNEESRDHELCLVALSKGVDAVPFIPRHLWRDRSFVANLREINPEAIDHAASLRHKTSIQEESQNSL